MLYSDNLSHIKSINYDVYSFLKSNDLLSLPDGLYELNDYSYCVVETFKGRSSKSSKYEFSSECLTIYIVVEGQEVIEVRQKKDSVSVCFGDHTQQRTTSYSSEFIDGKYLLKPGRFLFFSTKDEYVPVLDTDYKNEIKKAVFKIKVPSSEKNHISFLVTDVDGTLTDGSIFIGNEGEVFKSFNVKDGLGISEILPELEIIPVVITGRKSKILERRCQELGIKELHQGVSDKLSLLRAIVASYGKTLSEVAYIGDDVNDFECMREVRNAGGIVGCPADAVVQIIQISQYVATSVGGCGAVREFIDWLSGEG